MIEVSSWDEKAVIRNVRQISDKLKEELSMGKNRELKKMRKAVRKEKEKVAGAVVNDFRIFINELPFRKRLSLAWRILWKTY